MSFEEKKSLAALYSEINEQIDTEKSNSVIEIIKNIRAKMSLIKGIWVAYNDLSKINPEYTAHDSVLHVENVILNGLKKVGIDINITVDPNLDKENIGKKGSLVFINHQGGGLETYISRSLLESISDQLCHWLLKDSLMKIPFYGDVLKAHDPIVIKRDPENFSKEIMTEYGKQIADMLKKGHNVIMAFEGTRSQNGEIVKKHKKLASLFKLFIKQHISEDLFNQLLITVDTFSTMPEPIEKNIFGKIRTESSINAYIEELPHSISLDPKKDNNIFQIAEHRLHEMLSEKLDRLKSS